LSRVTSEQSYLSTCTGLTASFAAFAIYFHRPWGPTLAMAGVTAAVAGVSVLVHFSRRARGDTPPGNKPPGPDCAHAEPDDASELAACDKSGCRGWVLEGGERSGHKETD